MNRTTTTWSVERLRQTFHCIAFPDYQREPTVWSLDAKRRLIDSILRDFDIGSLFLYQVANDAFECIDGRQRINAILSFMELNTSDEHNGFNYRILNEIYDDVDHPVEQIDNNTLAEIEQLVNSADPRSTIAQTALARFNAFKISIVVLADSARPEEFNLQFTRLNLGTLINAGEKLHAMVGAMRDLCFEDTGLANHPFLEHVNVPTRRYAKEQVIAQILAQVFAKRDHGRFATTRHFDLQRFFKDHATLTGDKRDWVEDVRSTLDGLAAVLGGARHALKNRAMAVTVAVVAWNRSLQRDHIALAQYASFVSEFGQRLRWQVGKGLDVDAEYRYLIDFQKHVTQASVERAAVQARFDLMNREYERFLTEGMLQGDADFRRRTNLDPSEVHK